ncbi:MAG: nucleotide sugar dehydrogenase [Dehalococcoidia bacterium]|nr:nucleotide sugar dehydrogenase [Dehalococcoidia bacterium]
MKVAVVGQGYVGLTATACLAGSGHTVVGVEADLDRLVSLEGGVVPFFEPGLPELVQAGLTSGRIRFAPTLAAAGPVEAIVVAVGTPQLPGGNADLRQIARVLNEVRLLPQLPRLVLVKSTMPPGTSDRLLAETEAGAAFSSIYAYNPEFLSQGQTIRGWTDPTRIVVGLYERRVLPIVRELYRGIEAPWVVSTPTNAEMIKYASNAFLATRISFINEIANLCDEVGADVDEVARGMQLDTRIGAGFLAAGVGYGGSCFPKDTRALTYLASSRGRRMRLLESVIQVNNGQHELVRDRLLQMVEGVKHPVVAILGLSFKPGTDDLREAPSLSVVPDLVGRGCVVRLWDPAVRDAGKRPEFAGASVSSSLLSAVRGAHAALVLTEWPEVVEADWGHLASLMRRPRAVMDGRNCLDAARVVAAGLKYRGVGRAPSPPRVDGAESATGSDVR